MHHAHRHLTSMLAVLAVGLFVLSSLGFAQPAHGYACKASGDCGDSSDPGKNSCGTKEKEQRYCPSEGDTCSGETTYICDSVCENSSWTSSWGADGVDQCGGGNPENPPPPTVERGLILGRVYQHNPSCTHSHNYYGNNCGTSACSTGPNYSVTWRQGDASATTTNRSCEAGSPNYSFEGVGLPVADADGERVRIALSVQSQDQQWGVTHWFRNTTRSDGTTCKPTETGQLTRGLSQEVEMTVYADGDCRWNHIWFSSAPAVKVAGCFYDGSTGQQLTQVSTPAVQVLTSDGDSKVFPVQNGCYEAADFVTALEGYAVRPEYGAPNGYEPPALTQNDSRSFIHCPEAQMNTPKGYHSYECQMPGQQDCGVNCDFTFTPVPQLPKPDPAVACSADNQSIDLRWKHLADQAVAYIVRVDIDKPCVNQSGETINWYCSNTGDQYAIVEASDACSNPADPGYCSVTRQIVQGANYVTASVQWVGSDRNTTGDITRIGESPAFRCPSSLTLPDCTNLTGPTSVAPGERASYSMTVDGSQAPVTGISLLQRAASCASLREIQTISSVAPAGGTYQLNWTAPLTEGTYTLFGRVWSTPQNSQNWSECRAECLDPTNPLLYLCPSAQANPGTCKLTVTVAEENQPENVTISGRVRLGTPQQNAGGSCPANQGNPYYGSGAVVPANGSPVSLNSQGEFSFTRPRDPAQSVSLKLDGYDATLYTCSCPGNQCSHSVSLAQDGTYDFYLSTSAESWWQAEGSHIYSSNSFRFDVPASCGVTNACKPFLITAIEGFVNTAGLPITGGTLTGPSDARRESSPENATAENVQNQNPRESYDFFAKQVSLNQVSAIPTNFISEQSELVPHTVLDADGQSTLVSKWSGGTLTISPSDAWAVPAGTRHLIFIDGNLQLEADAANPNESLITVERGGYLMFVVRGSITIDGSVGNTSPQSNAANISGVYVADGQILIQDDGDDTLQDKKFVGEGSFVSWSSIQMNRDFSDDGSGQEDNASEPAQLFRFRPDFMKSVPPVITRTETIWQEIN